MTTPAESYPSWPEWDPVHDCRPVIEAPTGFGIFPKKLTLLPRTVAEIHTDLHR